jgi:[ribosomal protein S5]-alanine N-acetyltransferase
MLHTERLFLSTYEPTVAEAIFAILGDAEAMHFTQHDADLSACRHRLETHEAQRAARGYAPWVIREATNMRVIGWGGIYDDPFDTGWGPEVGYFFARSAWGRGFATELVRYSLSSLQPEWGLRNIRAFAHPMNVASHNVLTKCGFTRVEFVPSMNRWLYETAITP